MKISPIHAFKDNYIWIIEKDAEAIVVDPGEADGVLDYLHDQEKHLSAILLTHNHADHVGGVEEILAAYPHTLVYGPEETKPLNNHALAEGDTLELFGEKVDILHTPGHTVGHISYLFGDALFCGDSLFSAGTGRVFTGDYKAQYNTLQKFNRLDGAIKVYAAHEYTEKNLQWAKSIQPMDKKIKTALADVRELRKTNRPTLPSTIAREKEINLLLQAESVEQLIELRQTRDNF